MNTPKSENSIRNIPINDKLYRVLIQYKKTLNDEDFVLTGSKKNIMSQELMKTYSEECF